jgi:competence ComEA-like helix-hairpin-helix protein
MTPIEKKAIWLLLLLWVGGFTLKKINEPELILTKKRFKQENNHKKTQDSVLHTVNLDSNTHSELKKANSLEKKVRIPTQKININTASIKQLRKLPGIGSTLAKRIVEFRTKSSLFSSHKELLKVKGIGKRKLEKLLPHITFEEKLKR